MIWAGLSTTARLTDPYYVYSSFGWVECSVERRHHLDKRAGQRWLTRLNSWTLQCFPLQCTGLAWKDAFQDVVGHSSTGGCREQVLADAWDDWEAVGLPWWALHLDHCTMCSLYSFFSIRPSEVRHVIKFHGYIAIKHIFILARSVEWKIEKIGFW